MKMLKLAAFVASASMLMACGSSSDNDETPYVAPDINMEKAAMVLETNADIAYATYSDSVATAVALKAALTAFRADPSQEKLDAAKLAWLVSREPYGQTEVYRFRNSPIDSTDYESEDGPEGDINAWPLGEALIDYVKVNDTDFGTGQIGVTAHSVGEEGVLPESIDVTNAVGNNIIETTEIVIDAALLANTASATDEHDVIAGYHAIEFLLWGQDLNNDAGVTNATDRDEAVKTEAVKTAAEPVNAFANGGQRSVDDFQYTTVNDNSVGDRRHQYLEVAVDKLIADLTQVQEGWSSEIEDNYRSQFVTIANEAEAKQKLTEILTGMGTLSEGELAGERMQIAFVNNSQEDEHSCFSDNTHRDIWLDAEGVSNSYNGVYAGYDSDLDGIDDVTTNAVNGYGIDAYLAEVGLESYATEAEEALAETVDNYEAIDALARNGQPFDVLIMSAPTEDSAIGKTIISLNNQAQAIQEIATALGLGDVVDDEASGCNTASATTGC